MAGKVQFRVLWLLPLLPLVAPSDPSKGSGDGLVVRVAQGLLRGKREQRPYAPFATVYAFEGVPYARPPVGELRFKDPKEPETWTGIRNASSFGPNCIQKRSISDNTGSVQGEEDCLFLNIYTVDPPNLWETVKRPVIVFIHGGAFVFGSGNTQGARPDPLLRQGLIFVTLNYRLGVMGFLNTEDAEAPGNAALKDQTMALRWVQANIAAFGGDPRNVAIMGESAGGASVNYHMISPLSRGLFQRAIAVSGTVVPRWATVDEPRQRALALRRLFAAACPDLPEAAIAPCLRRVNASALVDKQFDIPLGEYQNYFLKMTCLPSIEAPAAGNAPFLTADPVKLMEEGRVARVPYLTGFTTGEGLLYLWFAKLLPSQEPSRWGEVDSAFARIFRWDMPQGLRTPEATREVRSFYLGNRSLRSANDSVDTVERFQKMCTDMYMAVGISKTAELLAKNGGSVYVYQFSRDGPLGIIKQDMGAAHIPGVTHGDDMAYLFDFMNQTANEPFPVPSSEVPLRERQQKLFANFAKLGYPTPDGSGLVECLSLSLSLHICRSVVRRYRSYLLKFTGKQFENVLLWTCHLKALKLSILDIGQCCIVLDRGPKNHMIVPIISIQPKIDLVSYTSDRQIYRFIILHYDTRYR